MSRPSLWLAAAIVAAGPHAAAQTVAFVDVNVLPMDREAVLEHQTVLVRDGKIAAVGATRNVRVPPGATRVDGRGKYLMPGFAEMHGHLPNPNAPGASPELTEAVLFLYVANGVTAVRGMQGNPGALVLRDRIAHGEVLGPRLWVAGPPLSGNSAKTVGDARRMVEEQKAAGYDLLKIQEGLSAEVYDSVAATAKRVGITFAGHVPDAVGLSRALESGQATIDHLDNYVPAVEAGDSVAGLVAATRAARAWVVPTLALWETFLGVEALDSLRARAELRYVPPQWVANWTQAVRNMRQNNPDSEPGRHTAALRQEILKALADGGAGILFGTDSPQLFSVPGFSIHRETRSMLAAGLTPFQILQAGTRNVALYYGATDEFGTVAAGRWGDLILLEGNPLEDLGNLARRVGVMVNGRWLPESEIEARLERIAAGFAR